MSKTIDNINESIEDRFELKNKQDKTDSSLKTDDKTIVGAINELFQDVDSGKTIIADAIDNSTITKNSTFDAMGTAITLLHNQITNLTNELANKVAPAGTAVAGNVLSGKTFINSTGQLITGTMANNGAKTFTPKATAQTSGAGYYSGITVNGDSNLVAANIVNGKTIFGVTGTAATQPVYTYIYDYGVKTGITLTNLYNTTDSGCISLNAASGGMASVQFSYNNPNKFKYIYINATVNSNKGRTQIYFKKGSEVIKTPSIAADGIIKIDMSEYYTNFDTIYFVSQERQSIIYQIYFSN